MLPPCARPPPRRLTQAPCVPLSHPQPATGPPFRVPSSLASLLAHGLPPTCHACVHEQSGTRTTVVSCGAAVSTCIRRPAAGGPADAPAAGGPAGAATPQLCILTCAWPRADVNVCGCLRLACMQMVIGMDFVRQLAPHFGKRSPPPSRHISNRAVNSRQRPATSCVSLMFFTERFARASHWDRVSSQGSTAGFILRI